MRRSQGRSKGCNQQDAAPTSPTHMLQVPFMFKYAVDALTVDPTGALASSASLIPLVPAAALLGYGAARTASSLCNELRNAVFAKVRRRCPFQAMLGWRSSAGHQLAGQYTAKPAATTLFHQPDRVCVLPSMRVLTRLAQEVPLRAAACRAPRGPWALSGSGPATRQLCSCAPWARAL